MSAGTGRLPVVEKADVGTTDSGAKGVTTTDAPCGDQRLTTRDEATIPFDRLLQLAPCPRWCDERRTGHVVDHHDNPGVAHTAFVGDLEEAGPPLAGEEHLQPMYSKVVVVEDHHLDVDGVYGLPPMVYLRQWHPGGYGFEEVRLVDEAGISQLIEHLTAAAAVLKAAQR